MQENKPIEEQINEACKDVNLALLANMRAKAKMVEVGREQTRTHYDLLKAKERLASLEQGL